MAGGEYFWKNLKNMKRILLLLTFICVCASYWACKKNETGTVRTSADPFVSDALGWIQAKISESQFQKLDVSRIQTTTDSSRTVAAKIFLKGEVYKFVFISKDKSGFVGNWVEHKPASPNDRIEDNGIISTQSFDDKTSILLYYKNGKPVKFIQTINGETKTITADNPNINSINGGRGTNTTSIKAGVQMRETETTNDLPPVTVTAYVNNNISPSTLYGLYYYNPAPTYQYSYVPTAPTGGSGGGAGGTVPSTSYTITLGSATNPIGNINDYKKCFVNMPGNGYSYTITICVNQPKAGTRTAWGFSGNGSANSSSGSNPVNVGHTFLIFSETTPSGTITRNIGLYPQTSVSPIQPSAQGQLNNDASRPVDVSVAITMTNSQFFSALDYVSMGNNSGFLFNLNSTNCTSFALSALSSAGFNLPRTVGDWPGGHGNNPGDLGEDLRSMTLPAGMTRNTTNYSHPNVGTCY